MSSRAHMGAMEALPTLLLLAALTQDGRSGICNVADFGAAGDGILLDTAAIQSAIDACTTVYFPPGRFLTGAVFLRSGVLLQLDPGATILGSSNRSHYPPQRSKWYVILAENAEQIGVTGGGVLDGQSSQFVLKLDERKNFMISWNTTGACLGLECRPRLLGFVNCRDVRVWNVHLRQSAYWSLHVANSSSIFIDNVTIDGDFNTPNNDGIDIDGSNNTYISNCRIETADDGIVAKSIAGPLLHLLVTNCWIKSKSCALKVGSETYHDISCLHFANITIVDSHRGLGIQLRDSGRVSEVMFSDIVISTRYYDPLWWGMAEPIYVTVCPRNSSTSASSINNVQFVNIQAISENGIFLAALGGGNLQGLHFSNIQLLLSRSTRYPGAFHDYRPGCQGLVSYRKTSGIFMEHLEDISFRGTKLEWRTEDWGFPLDFGTGSFGSISFIDFSSNIYSS